MDQTQQLPYEGQQIYMNGKVWTIPGLSVKHFRKFFPVLAKSTPIAKDASVEEQTRVINEGLDERLPAILAAMQRNYPDLTQEQLEDMLDAANIVPIIQAISRGSGMRPAKPGE
jgi:hypothetical protein